MSPAERQIPAAEPFAERLRRLMQARGYSHRSLARELGASKQSVTNWTQGHAEPSLKHLRNLARVLETPPGRLIGEEPPLANAQSDAATEMVRDLAALTLRPALSSLSEETPSLLELLHRAERHVQELADSPAEGENGDPRRR